MGAVIVVHSFPSVTGSRQEIEDQVALSAPLRAGWKEMTLCSREAWGSFVPTVVSGENIVCCVSSPHRESSVVWRGGKDFSNFSSSLFTAQVNRWGRCVNSDSPPYSFSLWLTALFWVRSWVRMLSRTQAKYIPNDGIWFFLLGFESRELEWCVIGPPWSTTQKAKVQSGNKDLAGFAWSPGESLPPGKHPDPLWGWEGPREESAVRAASPVLHCRHHLLKAGMTGNLCLRRWAGWKQKNRKRFQVESS